MTQLSLEHLSGARRGEVDTLSLASLPATIGSGPEARVIVPGAAPLHARVEREGQRVLLRDGGSGQVTFLAGAPVHEVPLHDGDILELGSGGPRLRFHRVRRVRLFEHRDFRVALALVLVAGAGLGIWTFRLNRQMAGLERALLAAEAGRRRLEERVEAERRKGETDRESLENRIEESRRREEDLRSRLAKAAGEGEVRTLHDDLKRVRSRLVTLEGERAAGERVIRDYGAGVCLIQGTYAFFDAEGRPLRYRVDGSGQKVREADGSAAVGVDGTGPVHAVDCVGTGFLMDRRGFVVTNRHVGEPWWKNEAAEALAREGFKPRFLSFRAFFPRVGEALKAALVRVSPTVDVAVLKVDVKGRKVPALPLDASGRGAVPGQPVVVVGYPTGLEAILAKTDGSVVEEILSSQGANNERITEALSHRGLIRPSTTQGHIGDVTGTDIVFDAPTTQGGSGGPVFNKYRRVIAVEYAMLPQFAGNSYGVPIRYALELIEPKKR
ncbi:MAG TPA: trypsin-like peptidase domain-containing protein [Vicinamibacteria bacterium]|nr:trypsin-like peptidase domain-containing protein [Vicinamibacteria bacterium]